jgi:hypothetical protein
MGETNLQEKGTDVSYRLWWRDEELTWRMKTQMSVPSSGGGIRASSGLLPSSILLYRIL